MNETPARHVFLNLAQVTRALNTAAVEVDPRGDNETVEAMIQATLATLLAMQNEAERASGRIRTLTTPGDPAERLTLEPATAEHLRGADLPEGTTNVLEPGLYVCEDHDRRARVTHDGGLVHMDHTACRE